MGSFSRLDEVEEAPEGGRVVAIGVFDGVHVGHRSIIVEAVAAAAEAGARPSVVTFYPHPEAVLRPGAGPAALTLPGRKTELLVGLGIQEVITVTFDQQFARLSPEAFCSVVLSARLDAKAVLVGENFHFGRGGAGRPHDLARFGEAHGFAVRPIALVSDGGSPVSSTRIRGLLSAGEVEEAAELLGRPHRLEGAVIKGEGRGRTLDAPTANLQVSAELAMPAHGVYATRTLVQGGAEYDSVTSIGTNPTFGTGDEIRVETLLLDYHGDLYGSSIAVDLVGRIREQRVFGDADALAAQIRVDVTSARELHKRLRGSVRD
jgi:riboflavin kinase/FMN adenylyltransferase